MRDPEEELRDLETGRLLRRLRRLDSPQGPLIRLSGGRECLNFSSNDYLGLADNDELKEAYRNHISTHGIGSGSSRLICGTMGSHLDLEEKIASLKRSPSALTFTSGYTAATGTLSALCGKGDFILLDKLCHASLVDGARLSGATLRIFHHNDLDRLKSHLLWASERVPAKGRILVVTESVFSMDGDLAPLREICDLKDRHGALLLVDEAHSFGILGPEGRGLAAALGLESRIDLQMGTFSKAAGLSGGYLCSTRVITDLLLNRARSFVYSTAPSPALAATISDAIDLMSGIRGESLRDDLNRNRKAYSEDSPSAIFPLVIGDNKEAMALSAQLQERGFLVPAIRYPSVPRGSARLRVTLTAAHRPEQISSLKNALAELGHGSYDPPL